MEPRLNFQANRENKDHYWSVSCHFDVMQWSVDMADFN